MNEMSDELLRRIAARANDPGRRYMTAGGDEAKIVLPVDEIERRREAWTRRLIVRSHESRGEALSDAQLERYLDEWRAREAVQAQMMAQVQRSWGQTPPAMMSLLETDDQFSVSTAPPGATPLAPPPGEDDWAALARIAGRPIPDDLRRLYGIADGGFGPGFTGLNPVARIGTSCADLRRRGPDYCGTVAYPDSYLPVAEETRGYHYDLETGRIVSSNQDWSEDGLTPDDIYAVAFPSLAAMMEDWLGRDAKSGISG